MRNDFQDWEKMRRKPVAILGAGVSGRGVGALLDRIEWKYETYDEQGRVFGITEARACSLVVFSPGFAPAHSWLELARSESLPVMGEMDFGARFLENPVVAVTGTNGKTTLTTLLTQAWNALGKSAVAAGNVGLPLCELLASGLDRETLVFLEVSSFQAQGMKNLSPMGVLWTNFGEDHLDHHKNEEEYFLSKANLVENAGKGCVMVGRSVAEKARELKYALPDGAEIVDRKLGDASFLPESHFLSSFPQLENLSIAKAFASSQGIGEDEFNQAVLTYQPEPHRLQKIATIGKATFWNDSKATNAAAAVAACRNFSGNLFWIGGGKSKGEDSGRLSRLIKPFVKRAYVIGEMGEILGKTLREQGIVATFCNSLKEAVTRAYEEVTERTTVLFSPGFASFDCFANYAERGKSFVESVFDLKKLVSGTTQGCIN